MTVDDYRNRYAQYRSDPDLQASHAEVADEVNADRGVRALVLTGAGGAFVAGTDIRQFAEDAARFYAKTFPDSSVGAVHRAPGDFPSGKQGDVLTVEFTVMGIPCLGLNGGPAFKHNEAFSFQVATADQAETDRYWNAIVGNGGQESACGWCKDRWGLSWQITPRVLTDAMAAGAPAADASAGSQRGEEGILEDEDLAASRHCRQHRL